MHPNTLQTLELARRLISRAPVAPRLIDRLEQRGLLEGTKSENRRVVEVRIGVAGIELLDRIHAAVQACHQRQLGHISESALHQLAQLLRRPPHEDSSCLSFLDK